MKHVLKTRKGEFNFEYFPYYNPHVKADVYIFNIWKEGDNSKDVENFSFVLRVMENRTDLKVIDLYANKYKGYGISIPIILKSKELLEKESYQHLIKKNLL